MTNPSPNELRIAARVIRWATMHSKRDFEEKTWLQRFRFRLTKELDTDEMMRKSALLEQIADEMENK